jgi:hypothetical protein
MINYVTLRLDLRIFADFISRVKNAYHSYKEPIRTTNNKIFDRYHTYIFLNIIQNSQLQRQYMRLDHSEKPIKHCGDFFYFFFAYLI